LLSHSTLIMAVFLAKFSKLFEREVLLET